jgi:hypothetical protein
VKVLGSFILFMATLFFIGSRMNREVVTDTIDTKVSAIRRETPLTRDMLAKGNFEDREEIQEQERVSEDDSEPAYAVVEEQAPLIESVSIADNEIEEEWHQELKNLMIRLEPEEGEAMFDAYVKEVSAHKAELAALSGEGVEMSDELLNEINRKSEARLDEILGTHSEEVNQFLGEFVDAVKQQNRAPAVD